MPFFLRMAVKEAIFPVFRPAPSGSVGSDHWLHLVELPKRVRVLFGGETIADGDQVKLLREAGCLPVYYFSREQVRMDLLEASEIKTRCPYKGAAVYWTVKVGDQLAENVAWSYPEPPPEASGIKDCIAFEWAKMEAWYEEEEEVFVHARDPYKRIELLKSSRHVRVVVAGEPVADTRRARILLEPGHPTRYYIVREDVRMSLLEPSATKSRCPYKGIAAYWSARIRGKGFPDIAWSYIEPTPEFPGLPGLICFFQEREAEIFVEGERVPAPKTKWERVQKQSP